MDPALNLGVLLSFMLPSFFDSLTQAKYLLTVPIFYMILIAKIPDSPQHLYSLQKQQVWKESICAVRAITTYDLMNFLRYFQAANIAHKFYKGTEMESLQEKGKLDSEHDSKLRLRDFSEWNNEFSVCRLSSWFQPDAKDTIDEIGVVFADRS